MCECKPLQKPEHEEKKLEYNRVWEYFKYHAEQRLVTFRFYLIIVVAILSGLIFLFTKKTFYQPCLDEFSLISLLSIKLLLGFLLIIISIIFWKLDTRNDLMIDVARERLIEMEKNDWFQNKIFSTVEYRTKICHSTRFRDCFHGIFLTFIIIGTIFSFYFITQLFCS